MTSPWLVLCLSSTGWAVDTSYAGVYGSTCEPLCALSGVKTTVSHMARETFYY